MFDFPPSLGLSCYGMWNKEKDFHMMTGIATKCGNLEVGNIADNLNNYEEFAVKA